MEFENANNVNLALEESMKKKNRHFSRLVHRLKKLLIKAKPSCPMKCTAMNCEEEDAENRKNEEAERRMKNMDFSTPDMKPFFYTTLYQQAESQVF